MLRRILGVIMLMMGIGGILLAIGARIMLYQLLDNVVLEVDNGLQLTSQSLDNVEETLLLAKETVADVNLTMGTVQTMTNNLAQTINETRPLIAQSSVVATEQVPDSIEAVQEAIPALTEVAGTIDNTLTTLSKFKIERDILGFDFNYDLGIDYDPEVRFDDAVAGIGDSMDGLPESLRTLSIYLNIANENLDTMSTDILALSSDLGRLNEDIAQLDPILDEYIRLVIEVNDSLSSIRVQINEQVETAKNVATIAFIWLGLTQIIPLYLGYELVTGQRDPARFITREEFVAWQNGQADVDVEVDTAVAAKTREE